MSHIRGLMPPLPALVITSVTAPNASPYNHLIAIQHTRPTALSLLVISIPLIINLILRRFVIYYVIRFY